NKKCRKKYRTFMFYLSPSSGILLKMRLFSRNYFGFPLHPPADHSNVMFHKAAMNNFKVQMEQVSRELWRRIWSEDKDITQPASLSQAAVKAGLSDSDIKELLELSDTDEIKDKLRNTTQAALDYRGCGLPMMVCHVNGKKEMFFGADRFELMADSIGEKTTAMTTLINTHTQCKSVVLD
uniref:DSBA-like thioredoxin domain-containing protein n=1 Tax=Anabas testudineus TaxID=64144 RepID=A0A3Q1J9B0_ANATE